MSDKEFYPSGQIKSSGSFSTGGWSEWYENGVKKQETILATHEKHQKSTDWYENGQKKYIYIKDEKTEYEFTGMYHIPGLHIPNESLQWYENGRLKERTRHVVEKINPKSKEVSLLKTVDETWNESGELDFYEERVNGFAHEYRSWHKNGFLAIVEKYEGGKPTGLHIRRNESWFRVSQATYINGNLDGEYIEWYEDGELRELGFYSNGKKHGKFSSWDENGLKTKESTFEDDVLTGGRQFSTKKFFFKKKGPEGRKPENGPLTFYWPNGNKKEQNYYKNGNEHGECTYWFYNGNKEQEGSHRQGECEGLYTWWFDNGDVRSKQMFENGKWHGECIWWYPDGTINSKSQFVEGKNHGPSEHYFRNGKLRLREIYEEGVIVHHQQWTIEGFDYGESDYVDGHLEGSMQTLFVDGSPDSLITKSKGHLCGPWSTWFRNGNKWKEVNYKPGRRFGVLDGKSMEWYVDGTPKEDLTYSDGQKHGVCRWWYRDGTLWKEICYLKDKPDGNIRTWHSNGQLAETRYLDNGRRIGEWISYNDEGRETNRIFYPDE